MEYRRALLDLPGLGELSFKNEPRGNRKETNVMVEPISREDLKAKIDQRDDFLLVETLSEEQYRHTHLPGAINLPPDRVRELAPELLPDKEADIVVYCGSPT
jgi:3-mercaptopyruvate sulfurtransferase SseA